jgi:hypothetical protein
MSRQPPRWGRQIARRRAGRGSLPVSVAVGKSGVEGVLGISFGLDGEPQHREVCQLVLDGLAHDQAFSLVARSHPVRLRRQKGTGAWTGRHKAVRGGCEDGGGPCLQPALPRRPRWTVKATANEGGRGCRRGRSIETTSDPSMLGVSRAQALVPPPGATPPELQNQRFCRGRGGANFGEH